MPSWFRALTGFEERNYADTQSRLRVVGDRRSEGGGRRGRSVIGQ